MSQKPSLFLGQHPSWRIQPAAMLRIIFRVYVRVSHLSLPRHSLDSKRRCLLTTSQFLFLPHDLRVWFGAYKVDAVTLQVRGLEVWSLRWALSVDGRGISGLGVGAEK